MRIGRSLPARWRGVTFVALTVRGPRKVQGSTSVASRRSLPCSPGSLVMRRVFRAVVIARPGKGMDDSHGKAAIFKYQCASASLPDRCHWWTLPVKLRQRCIDTFAAALSGSCHTRRATCQCSLAFLDRPGIVARLKKWVEQPCWMIDVPGFYRGTAPAVAVASRDGGVP